MLQNMWKKLSGNKKNQWIIMLLLGVLLVVIAIPTSTDNKNEKNYSAQELTATEMEIRLKNILEKMRGVGEVTVMITYQDETKVEGVVVVAQGAENSLIVQKITDVIRALFAVDSHKIKVIQSK